MGTALLQDREALRSRLAPHLGRARRAIVFGSAARGDADEWGDLDLVIVADTTRPFFERFKDFAGIHDVWRVPLTWRLKFFPRRTTPAWSGSLLPELRR